MSIKPGALTRVPCATGLKASTYGQSIPKTMTLTLMFDMTDRQKFHLKTVILSKVMKCLFVCVCVCKCVLLCIREYLCVCGSLSVDLKTTFVAVVLECRLQRRLCIFVRPLYCICLLHELKPSQPAIVTHLLNNVVHCSQRHFYCIHSTLVLRLLFSSLIPSLVVLKHLLVLHIENICVQ